MILIKCALVYPSKKLRENRDSPAPSHALYMKRTTKKRGFAFTYDGRYAFEIGKRHSIDKDLREPRLCTAGVFHAYFGVTQALYFNYSNYIEFSYGRMFLAQGSPVVYADDKCGTYTLKLLRNITPKRKNLGNGYVKSTPERFYERLWAIAVLGKSPLLKADRRDAVTIATAKRVLGGTASRADWNTARNGRFAFQWVSTDSHNSDGKPRKRVRFTAAELSRLHRKLDRMMFGNTYWSR